MIRDLEALIRAFPHDDQVTTWRGIRDRCIFTLRLVNEVADNTAQQKLF